MIPVARQQDSAFGAGVIGGAGRKSEIDSELKQTASGACLSLGTLWTLGALGLAGAGGGLGACWGGDWDMRHRWLQSWANHRRELMSRLCRKWPNAVSGCPCLGN
jgi:hypothetical protein